MPSIGRACRARAGFTDRARLRRLPWAGTGAMEIVPVVQRMRESLLGSARLFADETVMLVLAPGRGRTKKGYAWAIARDHRPWGGSDPPAVVFHYAPGRGCARSASPPSCRPARSSEAPARLSPPAPRDCRAR
ncbi:MAG: hypothetical protein EBY30_04220 [Rhodospirillales bacterium]|nr:hypothetical protein [Rhodospirillales bacterium]